MDCWRNLRGFSFHFYKTMIFISNVLNNPKKDYGHSIELDKENELVYTYFENRFY